MPVPRIQSTILNTLQGMDNRVVTTVRLPADLAAAAKEYAAQRRVSLTVVVEAALRGLLEDAQGGVPDLEQPHVVSAREMRRPAAVEKSQWEQTMRSRQDRLNKQKGM
jgi:hypothetical protein